MDFSTAIRFFQQGQLRDCEWICRQLLQSNPGNASALQLLGAIAGRVGKHAEAADLFRQAIAITPNHAEFHRNLAFALQHQGQLDDSATAFRTAIALQPDDSLSRACWGTC